MKRRTLEGLAGQPKVSVDESLVERFGEPRVDFDALEDLFFDTFKIPHRDEEPVVHLYQSRSRIRRGYHVHFTKTVHVNAAPGGELIDPLPALVHETKHMSDRYNNLSKLLGITGARMAIATAPAELNLTMGNPLWTIATTGLAGVALSLLLQDPLEKQALAAGQNEELLSKYAGIITFKDI